MATTGTATEQREPADLARDLLEADLVRVVSRADGDGLAGAAILANALADQGIPRHLSLTASRENAAPRLEEHGTAIALGFAGFEQSCEADSAALWASELARELGSDPDPGLALAGARAAGVPAQESILSAATEQGLSERPGLAIPTSDLTVGLAYTGWLHAEFSGDEEAARDFLETQDLSESAEEADQRRLGSAVALTVTDKPRSQRAVTAISNAIGTQTSPTAFETIGGYADVLNAAANMDPGAALWALLGGDETRLLDMWQDYGATVHETLHSLPTATNGVETVTVSDIPPQDVARLGRDFRTDADRLYVEGPETIALATRDENALETLTSHFSAGQVTGTDTLGTVRTTETLDQVLEDMEAAL